MNPHLPLVESVCALARGRFSGWDHQLLRWEGNRSLQLHTGLVRYLFDFRAYCVDILGVRAGQSNSIFGDHSKIPSSFYISRGVPSPPLFCYKHWYLEGNDDPFCSDTFDEIAGSPFLSKWTEI